MTEYADFLTKVVIRPAPGFEMIRQGREYLFVSIDDSTRNTLLDAETLSQLLSELLDGGPLDDFGHGLGIMWEFHAVTPMYNGGGRE